MTLEQIKTLTDTLETKVKEGLETLKDTPIDSSNYNVLLANIISSTTLINKIKFDKSDLLDQKGDA